MKHLIKIFMFALVITVTVVNVLSEESFAKGYSPGDAVEYALKYTDKKTDKNGICKSEKRNSKYKSFEYDCTNFVSQCVVAGGKKMSKHKPKTKDWLKTWGRISNTKYWQNRIITYGKSKRWTYTTSFTTVGGFYKHWNSYVIKDKKKKTVLYTSLKKDSPIQKKLKKGDIVQMRQGKEWIHSVIITGGKKGDWNFSCHTYDCRNRPLKLASGMNTYRIIRMK